MELKDPVVVYTAASNMQAYDLAEVLGMVNIPAHVVEDLETMAAWVGGINSVIHKPQVWVSRSDEAFARKEIQAYEERQRARRAVDIATIQRNQTIIFVTCERCGEESEYPVIQAGSVQKCPHCSAYLDVDVDSEVADLDVGDPEPPIESRFFE